MLIVPNVADDIHHHERYFDIYSRLLKDRIILLTGEINDDTASSIVAQLLYLDSENHQDIQLYINSCGGSVSAGLAIYDTMQYIRSDVVTLAVGMSASMAAILVCGGTKNKRYSLQHSTLLLHQPLGQAQGQATDIEITSKQIMKTKKTILDILVKHTKKDAETLNILMDRDRYFTAQEAMEYGLIDHIIHPQSE